MKTRVALFLGNRGFFPGELLVSAREEMTRALEQNGFEVLAMDASLTRFGGVETIEEGKMYADFLKAHAGEFAGMRCAERSPCATYCARREYATR